MSVAEREIHEKRIVGRLTEAEIKKLVLDHVAKVAHISEKDFTHSTRIVRKDNPTGGEYEAICEITIDMGSKP